MNVVEIIERKLDQLLMEPSNSGLINEIGVLLYRMKDWKSAELYFQKAYQLRPKNHDIVYNYAAVLNVQSKWKQAITIIHHYLELVPNDEEVMEKLADCYYLIGDYHLAEIEYGKLAKYRG
ncbi:hypothetical protein BKP37_05970 [Anaerobacillus alkalilacustris]|uniref:Uncharacterized protein n=1 Tax=Anaerobacillus alkalilacustris TaxID=393763 RepID=A0A1S2LW76_9BACI|nr:tetratricopeptide repeat protein [Anaerobacillus alkalilacustris]OIJ16769.1 hypothetical protein BKP37_05970 [Anaerobacillus alkalilacustris]